MWFFRFLYRLPRFYLWSLSFFLGFLIHLVDRVTWKLSFAHKTRYIKKGSCQRTGQCCHAIGIELRPQFFNKPCFIRFFSWYYYFLHRFKPLGLSEDKTMLVFECEYITSDRTCGIYPYRPKICREFPLTPLFRKPGLHKGCGFWFVQRSKLGTFEEELARKEHQIEREQFKKNQEISF